MPSFPGALIGFALLAASLTAATALGFDLKGLKGAAQQVQQAPAAQKAQQAATQARKTEEKVSTQAQAVEQKRAAVSGAVTGEVSDEEERKIGRPIAGSILGAAPLVNAPETQRYVNRVGRWVAAQSARPDLAWEFGVIESADLNAFAVPGGYVFITRGLYEAMRSEAELAGVLAHEVGHVVARHHLKILRQSQGIEGANHVAQKQLQGPGVVKGAAKTLAEQGARVMARGLDRNAEYEADRWGIALSARAGYDPYGLPSVLQTLSARDPGDPGLALLYKTHPRPEERLQKISEAFASKLDGFAGAPDLAARFAQHPLAGAASARVPASTGKR